MSRLSSTTRLVIGLVGGLAGLATILLLLGFLLSREPKQDAIAQPQRLTIAQLRQADRAALDSYGVIDRERGVVRIPIELAMQKALAESFVLPAMPTTRKAQ